MKKKFISLFTLLVSVALLSGCRGNDSSSTEEVPESYLLNSFEATEDLYRFKTFDMQLADKLDYSINKDKTFVSEGENSLKVTASSGSVQKLVFPFSYKDEDLFDFSQISDVSVDVYNACEEEITVNLDIYNSNNLNILLTNAYKLEAGKMSSVKFPLSAVAISNNYDNIKGVMLRFENTKGAATYYVDNLSVGLKFMMNEDDLAMDAEIKSIKEAISSLPAEVSMDNYDTIKGIYDRYIALPELYRSIISNYNTLYQAMQQLVEINNSAADPNTLSKDALSFDKFFGVGAIYNHLSLGGNVKFYYQTQYRYTDTETKVEEEGGVELNFNGSEFNYVGYTLPSDLINFDTVEFHFYNPLDGDPNQNKRVWFGWTGHYVEIPVDTWVTYKVPADVLVNSTYGMIFCQWTKTAEGTVISQPVNGKLIIGKAIATRKDYNEVAKSVNNQIEGLNSEPTTEIEKMQILSANQNYEALPEKAKTFIKNKTKLDTCYNAVNDIEFALAVNTTTLKGFNESSEDFTHGNLILGKDFKKGNNNFKAFPSSDLEKFASYKEVFFYVYVDESLTGSAGSLFFQYDKTWTGKNFNLKPGFNRISLSGVEWFSNNADHTGKLYAYISLPADNTIAGITPFYGVK